jgi:hypothetical protein
VDGNSARNLIDQPGYKDVDLAIFRTFKLRESFSLQARGEAMNVFNMVNLNAPNATAPATPTTVSTFGQITSAQSMRQLQLGVRLIF